MKFTLHFSMINAAFSEYPEDEICRRLLAVVAKIEAEGISVSLRPDSTNAVFDGDGKIIGEYAVEDF